MNNLNDVRGKRMPKAICWVWFVRELIEFLAVEVGLVIVGWGCWLWHFDQQWLKLINLASWFIAIGAALYYLIDMALIPYFYYTRWYSIDDQAIEIIHGVLVREHVTIPLATLQTVTIEQGVFLKKAGLWEVRLYTAADNFMVAALPQNEAKALRQHLVALINKPEDDDE